MPSRCHHAYASFCHAELPTDTLASVGNHHWLANGKLMRQEVNINNRANEQPRKRIRHRNQKSGFCHTD